MKVVSEPLECCQSGLMNPAMKSESPYIVLDFELRYPSPRQVRNHHWISSGMKMVEAVDQDCGGGRTTISQAARQPTADP